MTDEMNPHLYPLGYPEKLSAALEADMYQAKALGATAVEQRLYMLSRHAADLEDVAEKLNERIESMTDELDDLNELRNENDDLEAANTRLQDEHRELSRRLLSVRDQVDEMLDQYDNDDLAPDHDHDARKSVEDSLYRDGIIEDPDVDGGLDG